VWKRSHDRTSEAPPDERGGNSYARPYRHRATLRLYQLCRFGLLVRASDKRQ